MNDFAKGMNSVGQLFPAPYSYSDYPPIPERIMRMAEAHNAADVMTKNRISFSNLIVPIIG